jgi:hypothetical protein
MPSTTAPPKATPAAPPSVAPPPSWAASGDAPLDDPPLGGEDAASVGVGGAEPLVGELVAVLAVASAEAVADAFDPAELGFALLGMCVFPVLGLLLAELVGFGVAGFVLVGFGVGPAASCGQMTFAAVLGGGVLPPFCHTQPSVEPGFGLWLPAPSLA